jgi:hypothetical protein
MQSLFLSSVRCGTRGWTTPSNLSFDARGSIGGTERCAALLPFNPSYFLIDSGTKENLEKGFGEVSERAGDIEWRDLCE